MHVLDKSVAFNHLIRLALEKTSRSVKQLVFELKQTICSDPLYLLVAEEGVDRDDLSEQVLVDRLIPAVCLNLLEDRSSDVREHAAKNFDLELCKPLIRQACNRTHFNIKSVKVLEEPLHPLYHYLVVFPPQIQLPKELLSVKILK